MLLQAGRVPHQAPPAQDHRDFVRPHDGDPGQEIEDGHGADPPVHALPRGIEQAGHGGRQPANFRGGGQLSHGLSLLCRREKGSESVRRISEVPPLTSLSRDSSDRVKR